MSWMEGKTVCFPPEKEASSSEKSNRKRDVQSLESLLQTRALSAVLNHRVIVPSEAPEEIRRSHVPSPACFFFCVRERIGVQLVLMHSWF